MATDCTALEEALKALNEEQMATALRTTKEQQAANRLNELASREGGLQAAVTAYEELVTSFDNSIRGIELPLDLRIGDYEKGLKSLQEDRKKHVTELQQATSAADRARVNNNIAMMDAAILEHQLGIQQMKDQRKNSTADLRSQREEARRDLASHQRQLSDLQSELSAAAQTMQEAAETVRQAFEQLAELKTHVAETQQQLDDCRRKKAEEEAASSDGPSSSSAPTTNDPTRWFPP